MFRPAPKIVEVAKYVEVPVYETKTLEHGVAINREKPLRVTEHIVNVVPINKEVAVYVEKPV